MMKAGDVNRETYLGCSVFHIPQTQKMVLQQKRREKLERERGEERQEDQ